VAAVTAWCREHRNWLFRDQHRRLSSMITMALAGIVGACVGSPIKWCVSGATGCPDGIAAAWWSHGLASTRSFAGPPRDTHCAEVEGVGFEGETASTAFPRRSLGACSVYDRAGRARRRCGALSTLFGRALSRLAQFARHQQQLGGARTGRHVEQHIAEAAGKPTPQQREMPRPGVAKEAAAGQFRRCPRHPVS